MVSYLIIVKPTVWAEGLLTWSLPIFLINECWLNGDRHGRRRRWPHSLFTGHREKEKKKKMSGRILQVLPLRFRQIPCLQYMNTFTTIPTGSPGLSIRVRSPASRMLFCLFLHAMADSVHKTFLLSQALLSAPSTSSIDIFFLQSTPSWLFLFLLIILLSASSLLYKPYQPATLILSSFI